MFFSFVNERKHTAFVILGLPRAGYKTRDRTESVELGM